MTHSCPVTPVSRSVIVVPVVIVVVVVVVAIAVAVAVAAAAAAATRSAAGHIVCVSACGSMVRQLMTGQA